MSTGHTTALCLNPAAEISCTLQSGAEIQKMTLREKRQQTVFGMEMSAAFISTLGKFLIFCVFNVQTSLHAT